MNNIGDSGAKMIIEELKSNSTLTTLILHSDEKEERRRRNKRGKSKRIKVEK